jgi:hypothetical protein
MAAHRARAAAAAWLYPSLREFMYRLTWWSVACLPGINVSPAIAGETLSESLSTSHPTGHRSCRHPVIVMVAAQDTPRGPLYLQ